MNDSAPTFRNVGPLPREPNDWYADPPEATEALLRVERFSGLSWDPACGRGVIPEVMRAAGLECEASDIADRDYGHTGHDFLILDRVGNFGSRRIDNIISNPPFKLARPFVDKALTVAAHKVAMLLPLTFLEGQRKAPWLRSTPLARVHVFSWRISMPPGELLLSGKVKPEGGKKCFAWFVWTHGHQGPAHISILERPTT